MIPIVRRGLAKQARLLYNVNVSRSRLLSTLAVLEQRDGQLNHGSLSALTAAKAIGGTVYGFVAGSNTKAVAEQLAKVEGVEKIIAVENAAYDKVCAKDHALRLRVQIY